MACQQSETIDEIVSFLVRSSRGVSKESRNVSLSKIQLPSYFGSYQLIVRFTL